MTNLFLLCLFVWVNILQSHPLRVSLKCCCTSVSFKTAPYSTLPLDSWLAFNTPCIRQLSESSLYICQLFFLVPLTLNILTAGALPYLSSYLMSDSSSQNPTTYPKVTENPNLQPRKKKSR